MKNKAFPSNYDQDKGFYSVNGECITCGAPEAEAPDLIEHSEEEGGHCYFKRQPFNEVEIKQAVNAVCVSCISGLRYGGTNELILKALYEKGESAQCDNKPKGNYKPVIWERVSFEHDLLFEKLKHAICINIRERDEYISYSLSRTSLFSKSFVRLITWSDGPGIKMIISELKNKSVTISLSPQKKAHPMSTNMIADKINLILFNVIHATNIIWTNTEGVEFSGTKLHEYR